jgi:hypothetical protein
VKGPGWSAAESEYLKRYAGQEPFPDVVRRFHAAARANGWPMRSNTAIIQRLHRIGLHAGCRHGDWLTYCMVGELLGCSGDRVAAWTRSPKVRALLQPRWRGKARWACRANWRRLAQQMPRILGGYSADALFALLEDRELADQVAAEHDTRLGDWRVRCVETGRVYRNCSAAARELHVHRSTINLAIREGRPVAALGLTFEAMRKPQRPTGAVSSWRNHAVIGREV